MDASCFCVDWQSRPRFPHISQFGGNWSHFVTCAHVIAPWDYPNFYPPVGPTRFVSKITAADCETQIRQPSMQGDIVYRSFASKFTTFIHRNPRLDLAVVHIEQAMRRAQEMKMLWMQNEGFHSRPRFELLEEVREGDAVWIYGTTARGDIFDEESRLEPQMVPTGVRGVVKLVQEEHFFVDTGVDETTPDVEMGMCGAAVIRNGKCVGMLTSTVAATNGDQRVAKCAMCTHAHHIREFLLEVEQQMKNPPPLPDSSQKTVFQQRREEDGAAPPTHKDWEADEMRIARHVKVPLTLWKMEENWTCEEDKVNSTLWSAKNGLFSKETQEEVFGVHFQDTKDDGRPPEGHELIKPDGSRPHLDSTRTDSAPTNLYVNDAFVSYEGSNEDAAAASHVKDFYRGAMGADETDQMDKFKRGVEAANLSRAREELHHSAMNLESLRNKTESEGWRSTSGAGIFGDQAPRAPQHQALRKKQGVVDKGDSGSDNDDEASAAGRGYQRRSETELGEERKRRAAAARYTQPSSLDPNKAEAFRRQRDTDVNDEESFWGKH